MKRTHIKIFRADDEIHLERAIQEYLDMLEYREANGGQTKPTHLVDIKYSMCVIEKIDIVTYSAMVITQED